MRRQRARETQGAGRSGVFVSLSGVIVRTEAPPAFERINRGDR